MTNKNDTANAVTVFELTESDRKIWKKKKIKSCILKNYVNKIYSF